MWETDEEIMSGMKQKSTQAFKLFYDRYIDYVYRIVIGIVKNHHDALDLCQELFLEYFQKADTYNAEKGSIKAWIAVRAKSRSLDYLRKQNKTAKLEPFEKVDIEQRITPLDELEKREEEERVINLLLKLPESQRHAIMYNYYESMSHREIAKKINRPIGTVKSMIRYGVNNLRKLYESDIANEKRGDSVEKSSFGGRKTH